MDPTGEGKRFQPASKERLGSFQVIPSVDSACFSAKKSLGRLNKGGKTVREDDA